jgi:hypothetical protein
MGEGQMKNMHLPFMNLSENFPVNCTTLKLGNLPWTTVREQNMNTWIVAFQTYIWRHAASYIGALLGHGHPTLVVYGSFLHQYDRMIVRLKREVEAVRGR